MKDTRQLVARALLDLERRNAWSNLSLDHLLSRHSLPREDASFAVALFYGVIERRITLDAAIAAHSRRPPDKLESAVLTALRLGVYQLLYMDGVPDSAAVDESVELTRKLKKPHASGYVNGVLRSFLRDEKRIPIPEGSLAHQMAVEYSCPAPLIQQWIPVYGEEAIRLFLADSLGQAPIALRVNTLRTTSEELRALLEEGGVSASPHPTIPNCLLLDRPGSIAGLDAFQQGLFHIQDPSSQLCALALNVAPGHRVLDACAAPGGKTFTLMEEMKGEGEIIACDLHPKRVELIQKRSGEMKLPGITPMTMDMTRPADLGLFDRVLCDAPCSGYGVIRRKPEIKYKPLEEFTDLPRIQYKLLENSSHYCKEGGLLLYSTCTLNPRENQEVTDRFLEQHPAFSPHPLGGLLGEASSRTLLGEHLGDGFYLAAFVRREAL